MMELIRYDLGGIIEIIARVTILGAMFLISYLAVKYPELNDE